MELFFFFFNWLKDNGTKTHISLEVMIGGEMGIQTLLSLECPPQLQTNPLFVVLYLTLKN